MQNMTYPPGIDEVLKLLQIGGWALDDRWSRRRKVAISCIGALNFSIILVNLVLNILAISGGLEALGNGAFLMGVSEAMGALFSLCSISLFVFQSSRLKEINSMLKDAVYCALMNSPHAAAMYSRNRRQALFHMYFTIAVSFSIIILWIVLYIVEMISAPRPLANRRVQFIFVISKFIGMGHPFYFWSAMILKLPGLFFMVLSLFLASSITPMVCTLMEGQIHILMESLLNISGEGGQNQSPPDVIEREQSERTLNADCDRLKKCIEHHRLILRAVKSSRQFIAPFLFLSVCITAVYVANISVAATWCENVRSAAFSAQLNFPLTRKDLAFIIRRTYNQEKFSAVLTTSLTFHSVFKMLQLLWNYFTLCSRQRTDAHPGR
ncbi:uncharacterized protein [Bemisia tabaci]|uniref:uncharacterized protein isoform X2 n=1 Tax=Bemisia tabaci TaxID=7038 RepID=UPI003B286115